MGQVRQGFGVHVKTYEKVCDIVRILIWKKIKQNILATVQ